MLKYIEVDNFKSLIDYKMAITPMTVIVGNNAAGKSSVLQLLDLLCSSVREDFDSIITRRNWTVADIRSKCREKLSSILSIKTEYMLSVNESVKKVRWELNLKYIIQKNTILLVNERIVDCETKKIYLEYSPKGCDILLDSDEVVRYPHISGTSSMLKILVDLDKENNQSAVLTALKTFLIGVRSFELLSPGEMRSSSRGKSKSLSMSGKNLPSFLKNLSEDEKKHFISTLQNLLGERIEDVSTETKSKPGWTYINVMEKYQTRSFTVSSRQLSDGTLRLLAFIGLSESCDGNMMLLDEIENGINNGYSKNIMDIFYTVSKAGRQFITTTHSVAFLDYVDREDIIYLYRDSSDGRTVAVTLFAIPELQDKLEYMYPGEVLYNMTNEQIVELCMAHLR